MYRVTAVNGLDRSAVDSGADPLGGVKDVPYVRGDMLLMLVLRGIITP
jgi:hypothetical protein